MYIYIYIYIYIVYMYIYGYTFCVKYIYIIIKYLAINIGGYLCMKSLHSLITTWLNSLQKNLDDVLLKISARE